MESCVVTRENLAASLEAEIDKVCREELIWGENDCCVFAANVIRAALGYDPIAPFRGKFSDRDTALNVMRPLGLGYAARNAAKRHGWKRIDPKHAQTGDIGLVLHDQFGIAVVICKEPGWFIGRGDHGTSLIPVENKAYPRAKVRAAWSVLS